MPATTTTSDGRAPWWRSVTVLAPPIVGVLIAGLAGRLLLAYVLFPRVGFQGDLNLFRDWATTLAQYGPGGYYAHSGFADYPPGYLWLLWLLGVVAQNVGGVLHANTATVAGALVKLPAIFADVLAGGLLYVALREWASPRRAVLGAALFLFNPVAWYESALWGQVDVVGAVVLLAAILLLIRGRDEAATGLAVLATLIKVQLGIGLIVVGAVLVQRHLLHRSAPSPQSASAAGNDGWIPRLVDATKSSGPMRIVSSAAVAVVVGLAVILPFDLPAVATGPVASIPILGHVAGLLTVVGNAAAYYNVLTANAFNGWALVGPNPLSETLSANVFWTYDSLPVLGPISAGVFGAAGFLLIATAVVFYLLQSGDRRSILVGTTILAVAFFVVPTRAHERYLFPAFVIAAPLAALSVRWRLWYVALAVVNLVNLHAVLTLPHEGYGSAAAIALPFGADARMPALITIVALVNCAGLAYVIWQLWPAFSGAATTAPAADQPLQATLWDAATLVESPGMHVPHRVADTGGGSTLAAPEPQPGAMAPSTASDRPPSRLPFGGFRKRVAADLRAYLGPVAARLAIASRRPDRTRQLDREPHGRLDRRDLAVAATIFVVALGTRAVGLERPMTMYFDEVYHPRTAMEFLQGWRYGLPHVIYETTHPHVAKYIEALGLVAFGDNRVTNVTQLGFGVQSAIIDPFGQVPGANGSGGGRLLAVTTDGIAEISLADPAVQWRVPLPGASAIAVGPGAAVIAGTDAGDVRTVSDAELQTGTLSAAVVTRLGGPVRGLWPTPAGVIAQVGTDRLVEVDTATGAAHTTASVAAIQRAAPFSIGGRAALAVASATGLFVFDGRSLSLIFTAPLAGGATDVAYLDGSDALYRSRDMLTQPALYVATGSAYLATFTIPPSGQIQRTANIALPASVSQLRWNRTTNLVHMLGRTPAGQPSIYVLEPNSTATFADAPLPFDPVAWDLDVVPDNPDVDRESAVLLGAAGSVARVDVGSNAFGWRLPGVIAGALMAAALYLLARLLFRRRSVAVIAGTAMLLDGLLYAQSRIGMNDAFVGMFIVLAYLLLAALLRVRGRGRSAWLAVAVGLPTVGLLLGLALASKWVGAYAIGGAVVIALASSGLGRLLILAGLVSLTGMFGYLAVADSPSNFTFVALLLVVTGIASAAVARSRIRVTRREVEIASWAPIVVAMALATTLVVVGPANATALLRGGMNVGPLTLAVPFAVVLAIASAGPLLRSVFWFAGTRGLGPYTETATDGPMLRAGLWRDARWARGLPLAWALGCLAVLPFVVYVATYIPWATTTAGGPQLFPGWPPGHTGQTFLDLQADMYRYHNELRDPHASSSPWWAWPLDLKPIWGYDETFSGGREATVFGAGNLALFWPGIPATAFGIWQAWRRRSAALTFVVVAFLALWLPWARIDRVSYQYHWYTSLPFFFLLLAYFLAELWHGPSPGTWRLARLSAATAMLLPGVLWLGKGLVCGIAGVPPGAAEEVCGASSPMASIASTAYVLVAAGIAWWVILPAREPRRLVAGVLGAGAAFFVFSLPILAAVPLPTGWSVAYQQLLPTWQLGFQFGSNTQAVTHVAGFGPGSLALTAFAAAVAAGSFAFAAQRRAAREPSMVPPR